MSFIDFPPSQLPMEHEQHMHHYVTAHIFETYLEQPSHLLHASPWSPSYWKRNSFCGQRGTGGRHLRLVCASRMDALPCVPSLRSASPLFSLFSEGWERRASSLWSPHSHSCFSHASSRSSLKIPIPVCFFPLPSDFILFFCKGKTPSPILKCAHKLHNDSKSKRLSTAVYSIIALQRITKAYFQALTAQPSLQHTKEAYFSMLINQTAVLST